MQIYDIITKSDGSNQDEDAGHDDSEDKLVAGGKTTLEVVVVGAKKGSE